VVKDESAIAYARVDGHRSRLKGFEIYADRAEVIEQRYRQPAGQRHALRARALAADAPVEIDLGANRDIYLARVDWLPDAKHLLVQRQSRDQRTLDLLLADASTGATRVLLTESSESWVNLHNALRVLPDGKSFVWASERSGHKHLELRALDGSLIRPLTQGPWEVDELLALDAKHRRAYFTGNADDVRENTCTRCRWTRKRPDRSNDCRSQRLARGSIQRDASVYVGLVRQRCRRKCACMTRRAKN
jgi:dipeptidyl-peptidase-4